MSTVVPALAAEQWEITAQTPTCYWSSAVTSLVTLEVILQRPQRMGEPQEGGTWVPEPLCGEDWHSILRAEYTTGFCVKSDVPVCQVTAEK